MTPSKNLMLKNIYISVWKKFVLGLELRFSHICHVELGSWRRRKWRMEKNRSQLARKYGGKISEPDSRTEPKVKRK